jgi:hypothetical protein
VQQPCSNAPPARATHGHPRPLPVDHAAQDEGDEREERERAITGEMGQIRLRPLVLHERRQPQEPRVSGYSSDTPFRIWCLGVKKER